MPISLTQKNILIISPQPWSNMFISKHNFAIELAQRNNFIYFLNPPSFVVSRGEIRIEETDIREIKIINWKPLFPLTLRHKLPGAFNFFQNRVCSRILDLINTPIDIVIDFEPTGVFTNLKKFKAQCSIYFPVDVTLDFFKNSKMCDFAVSISPSILDKINISNNRKLLINHGVNGFFEERAKRMLSLIEKGDFKKTSEVINVGYVGNLLLYSLDRNLLIRIIDKFPNIKFHFWGPYETNTINDHKPNPEIERFVNALKSRNNAILYGLTAPSKISRTADNIDLYLVCINNEVDNNKGVNSHKILEYFTSGKVVVSSWIDDYRDRIPMIVMKKSNDPDVFCSIFSNVINNLNYYNSQELALKRIQYALQNTYRNHVDAIEKKINEVLC
jgi:hypothetical protein